MQKNEGMHLIGSKGFLVLAIFFLITGCASTIQGVTEDFNNLVGADNGGEQEEQQEAEATICERNFSVSGSFFSGKKYVAYQEFTGLSESRAFKNVAQYLATQSWNIVNTDPDLGIMTATQGAVGSNKPKDIPLNILVKKQNSNSVSVQATLSLSPGNMTSEDGQRSTLCKLVESAAN